MLFCYPDGLQRDRLLLIASQALRRRFMSYRKTFGEALTSFLFKYPKTNNIMLTVDAYAGSVPHPERVD